jgi:bidirectional [NiFe] hydrogenase diaphorase subunit
MGVHADTAKLGLGHCVDCNICVQVCPTGALSEKGRSIAEMSKQRQFLPYLTLMREGRR